jgi:hypothetical protein
MHRTEFEQRIRQVWIDALAEARPTINAAERAPVIARLTETVVGLAYAEKLLDQGRPQNVVTGPSSGPIYECRVQTGHARLPGYNQCRCGHTVFFDAEPAPPREMGR